jgi:Rad3-related DNA helicase
MGLGDFQRVIFDEAHNAPEELASALQVRISYHEIEEMLGQEFPKDRESLAAWKSWASRVRMVCQFKLLEAKVKVYGARELKHSAIREYQHLVNLNRKLGVVAQLRPADWIVDEWVYGYQFDPIRIARYSESTLFLRIPRVSFFSATIRPKTLAILGVDDDYDFWDYPSTFDPRRSPVRWVSTVRVDHRLTPEQAKVWGMRVDQIVQRRYDRRGMIHTVSYKKRNELLEMSDFRPIMMSNFEGDITSQVVQKFKATPPPVVLVSPSVTTGYDFPYDDCRYQIIGKIPFPDSRSKIIKARQDADPEYGPYLAMQQLVQSAGRIMRAPDDWGETIIIDDHAEWFIPKFKSLAPQWFLDVYDKAHSLPKPLSEEDL